MINCFYHSLLLSIVTSKRRFSTPNSSRCAPAPPLKLQRSETRWLNSSMSFSISTHSTLARSAILSLLSGCIEELYRHQTSTSSQFSNSLKSNENCQLQPSSLGGHRAQTQPHIRHWKHCNRWILSLFCGRVWTFLDGVLWKFNPQPTQSPKGTPCTTLSSLCFFSARCFLSNLRCQPYLGSNFSERILYLCSFEHYLRKMGERGIMLCVKS